MPIVCMQAYYAVAQPLLLQQVQAEQLPPLTKPSAGTMAPCTLKRKLEDCGVDLEALQDHTNNTTSSGGPVAKKVACASNTVPQRASQSACSFPAPVQAVAVT